MKQNFSKSTTHSSTILFSAMVLLFLFVCSSAIAQRPGQSDAIEIDAKYQKEVIDSVSAALNSFYVFPEIARKMEKQARQQFKQGKYKELTNLDEFTMKLTEDMFEICQDKHFGIRYQPDLDLELMLDQDSLSEEEREKIRQENILRMSYSNYDFEKIEILPGNIGYLKLNGFNNAEFAGPTAVAAMNFLSNTDALIIDLRENGGGSPSMIQLITSYFFDEPVHLNSFYIRETDSIKQFWTQSHVEGPRMSDVDIFILTSNQTFSAAEEFTYNLKNLERATVIGETTGGGAHPVSSYYFPNLKVGIRVPFGKAINPITGTNWEGVGVKPDIDVPADQALELAKYEAMKKMVDKAKHEQIRLMLQWDLTILKAKFEPYAINTEIYRDYIGDYGPRHIILEDDILYYQRDDRPRFKLIAISDDTFLLEGMDRFRLQFVKDELGVVVEILGMYDRGFTDRSPRDK